MLRYALLLNTLQFKPTNFCQAVSFNFIKPSEETYWRWNWVIESNQSFIGTRKNWTGVVLLLGDVYLQKDSQYQDGKLVGAGNERIYTKMLWHSW